jgi:hypothetical protein
LIVFSAANTVSPEMIMSAVQSAIAVRIATARGRRDAL